MSATLETALTRYQRRTGLKPDGVVAPDGPTIQRVNAEAADTATMADTPATPPPPARKPGSDVTPASPDKRRTIGATREQRADPSYQPTEADRLLSRIGNTVIEIEKIDDRIAAIEEDIRAERDRLRGHLIESAQDGSSTAKSALERLEAAAKKAAKKLNPVERVKDIYEIANAVKDVPSRAGEFKNIPDRINRWRSEIEDLEASRQRLERELENLRNTRSEKFPRHVPAYDRRAE